MLSLTTYVVTIRDNSITELSNRANRHKFYTKLLDRTLEILLSEKETIRTMRHNVRTTLLDKNTRQLIFIYIFIHFFKDYFLLLPTITYLKQENIFIFHLKYLKFLHIILKLKP